MSVKDEEWYKRRQEWYKTEEGREYLKKVYEKSKQNNKAYARRLITSKMRNDAIRILIQRYREEYDMIMEKVRLRYEPKLQTKEVKQ